MVNLIEYPSPKPKTTNTKEQSHNKNNKKSLIKLFLNALYVLIFIYQLYPQISRIHLHILLKFHHNFHTHKLREL